MDLQKNISYLATHLKRLIEELPRQQVFASLQRRKPLVVERPKVATVAKPNSFAEVKKPAVQVTRTTNMQPQAPLPRNKSILAIGVSTGGPNALAEIIPKLPATINVPVVIVQHMPASFTAVLAESLDKKSALHVVEACHGDVLKKGTVYIAPGGKQMRLKGTATSASIEITDDPPVRHCKPSVDYLFESVASVYGSSVLATILTGMGDDGTEGCRVLKARNAHVCVQSGDTCVVNGMPKSALEAGVVDTVLPLFDIAPSLTAVL
jgi:two-component system chemotaxis response regulator CheB